MNQVYQDAEYNNLIWMEFEGPTWDELHTLLSQLAELSKTRGTSYCLVFSPLVDMPRGNPMPHIKRFMKALEADPNYVSMIAVLPRWMVIASAFTRVAARMFGFSATEATTVTTREEAIEAFRNMVIAQ